MSCQESDIAEGYSVIEEANTTLTGQFKAIWQALNYNYPIWDYEKDEYGIDWDDVYNVFLPKFEKLDDKYNKDNPIPSDELAGVYRELFMNLHDGHTDMSIKNIHTDWRVSFERRFVGAVVGATTLNPTNERMFDLYGRYFADIYNDVSNLNYKGVREMANFIEENFIETRENRNERYLYGRTEDNILYLGFSTFNWIQFLGHSVETEIGVLIKQLWQTWFDKVQELHNNGTLKGVIFDLRNNRGGSASDYRYTLGALHQPDKDLKNGRKIGYMREKKGVGRLDYANEYPMILPTYQENHATIDEPIVVLADSLTRSMGEILCLQAKEMNNGCVIGTHTWGGLSASYGQESNNKYSKHSNWGNIGDPKLETTSFYLDLPSGAFLTNDKKILEGKGVEPDIEVFLKRGKDGVPVYDTQFEAALDYIRYKNK